MKPTSALYEELEHRLLHVDFEAIYPGFHIFPFALYDDSIVLIKRLGSVIEQPWDKRFLGNTSIEYEGERIAIWNIGSDPLDDMDRIAANMVHEMFHAYQFEFGETRFPNDIAALSYPDDALNLTVKHCENKLIAQALSTPHDKTLLSRVFMCRDYRESLIGHDMLCYEKAIETIEGLAEYSGLQALASLAPKKYEETVQSYIEKLVNPKELLLDTRRISYFSGAMFFVALKRAGVPFVSRNVTTPVFDLVKHEFLIPVDNPIPEVDADTEVIISNHLAAKNKRVAEFLNIPRTVINGDFLITGYDPMNMFKKDDRIFCSHFVFLTDMNTNERSFIPGPVLLSIKGNDNRHICAYSI